MPGLVNAIVVAESRLFREGLALIVSSSKIAVGCASTSFAEALEHLRAGEAQFDLIIGDPKPDLAAENEAILTIRKEFPGVKIVTLARTSAAHDADRMIRHGISGLFSFDMSAEALRHALELVLLGGTVQVIAVDFESSNASDARGPIIDDGMDIEVGSHRPDALPTGFGGTVAKGETGKPEETGPTGLSDREGQFLNCLLVGMSNKLIARHLDIAEATVKVHLRSVLRKLKVQNRTQAAIWALQNATTPTQFAAAPAPYPVPRPLVSRREILGHQINGACSV